MELYCARKVKMSLGKEKKTTVAVKIQCEKCGKEDYVPFVADGKRSYYCNDCLTSFNQEKKKGKVKKVFDNKKERYLYQFICSQCEKFFSLSSFPKEVEDEILCPDCYEKHRLSQNRKKRKNIVIV